MSKKPALTIVDRPAETLPPTPAILGEAGTKLWKSIQSEFRVDDAPGREMLAQICAAADRADECARAIAEDGAVIRTKAGFRDHPLLKHELAARSFICRALHRLGLDIETPRSSVGRPAGMFNKAR